MNNELITNDEEAVELQGILSELVDYTKKEAEVINKVYEEMKPDLDTAETLGQKLHLGDVHQEFLNVLDSQCRMVITDEAKDILKKILLWVEGGMQLGRQHGLFE